jgi:PAS domain S-box-containing protein
VKIAPPSSRTSALFRRLAFWIGVALLVLGLSVIAGWIFHIPTLTSIAPGMATMKPNTATAFLLTGAALMLQSYSDRSLRSAFLARTCALLIAAIGALTLIQYLLRTDLGIDGILINVSVAENPVPHPARMAANTALAFAFAGLVLFWLDAVGRVRDGMSITFTFALLLLGFIAACGYAFDARALLGVTGYGSMAIHTAMGFVLTALGLVCARPDRRVGAILAQDSSTGESLRRLAPVLLGGPLLLSWLLARGERAGLYGESFLLAQMVSLCTFILCGFAIWNALVQGRLELARNRARDKFAGAIDAAPVGMVLTDAAGVMLLANETIHRIFGYPKGELPGRSIELLVPERFRGAHPDLRASFCREPSARAMGEGRRLYGLRKDGSEVPIQIGLNPLQTSEGSLVLSSVIDITERQETERERAKLLSEMRRVNSDLDERVRRRTAELAATLEERDVLLQEIHHRVKNNLQVISSLINMQARRVSDNESRGALAECAARVQAIASIHEKLYQSGDYSRVPFSDYAAGLVRSIFHTAGVSPNMVSLDLKIDSLLMLPVDKAIPCGLILNELISNSLKHAFPGARRGKVSVDISMLTKSEVLLRVADDGVGMPAAFSIEKSGTLGMQLITTLVAQLKGQLGIGREGGTEFRVTFGLRESS